jgi:curved DNA-binding protein
MDFKDYYKILGVEADADAKAIKVAYRKLARKYHPDVSEQKDAEDRFKEVTEAYEVLGDAKKRAEYDELRQYGAQHGQSFQPPPGWRGARGGAEHGFAFGEGGQYGGDFSEFFESIFGGSRSGRRSQTDAGGFGGRGQDVELEMPIFLEDTIAEESKQIAYQLPHYDADGRRQEDVKKTLNVKIPKGVVDGQRIRLKGQGAPGIGDNPAGDLYIRIRLVPHPLFDVEGHNLTITVPLAPWEAALGAKLTLPTLHGKISLTIPANSQSGKRLRIKGKGLPGKAGQGDLYAVLNVVMPEAVTEASKAHWQALAAANRDNVRAEWSKYL